MLKKRVGAALLSLCLALGLCTPAYALEAEASPETASRTEDGSPDPYALTAPAPGAALLALPRAADIVKQGNLRRGGGQPRLDPGQRGNAHHLRRGGYGELFPL